MPAAPIVVAMGVSGSGKSSVGAALAARHGWAFVEGDDLHPPANVARMSQGLPLRDEDRTGWLDIIGGHIAAADRTGTGLVVACSALKRAYRDRLAAASSRLVFLHLAGERALVLTRMAARAGHFMPLSLLESQFATLEALGSDERAITVSIDQPLPQIVEEADRRLAGLGLREPAQ